MGHAFIRNQPGGWSTARHLFTRRETRYKMPSGEAVLKKLLLVLKRQKVRHRIIERPDGWEVRWV